MKPYYEQAGLTICHGDNRTVLAEMPDCSVDACVTDPPYELQFMNRSWDSTGIAYSIELWREVLRVVKPGGHLLAFGGTRTYHRMVCAVEDAGWDIRDCLMWVHAQGFPKSCDVSKQLDKRAGAEREVVTLKRQNGAKFKLTQQIIDNGGFNDPNRTEFGVTAPASDAAREWQGWGTALKPAVEPIVLARKPLSEPNVASNVLRWGVGALNIDSCRVVTADDRSRARGTFPFSDDTWGNGHIARTESHPTGRWPANLILSHHPNCECVGERRVRAGVWGAKQNTEPGSGGTMGSGWAHRPTINPCVADPDGYETVEAWRCVEGCPIKALDEQSGVLKSGKGGGVSWGKTAGTNPGWRRPAHQHYEQKSPDYGYGDSGGASRFFYCAKASRSERGKGNEHPTVKPVALMRWLVRLITPPAGLVLDPFMGSGTTLLACEREGFRAIGIDSDEHACEIARERIRQAVPPLWRAEHEATA